MLRHTVVIGGGIAGLAIAWQLARRGRRVTLLERELRCATHSSARNAQIWLPTDDDATTGPLALRSAELITSLLGDERAWLTRGGALGIVDDEHVADRVIAGATKGGVRARRVEPSEATRLCPALRNHEHRISLAVDGAGTFDPNRMTTALIAAARIAGVSIRIDASVRAIDVDDARVTGVLLEDGTSITADEVVNAAGAWAGQLGAALGATTTLTPLRRHLVLLDANPAEAGTVVWSFGAREVYFRPETGRVLASPCDETPFAPSLPPTSDEVIATLLEALLPVAPSFVDAPVRTAWACLRTYAHDRELVLGPDARVPGLSWFAGFGGRGMTVAVGAAELLAKSMDGDRAPFAAPMSPDRDDAVAGRDALAATRAP